MNIELEKLKLIKCIADVNSEAVIKKLAAILMPGKGVKLEEGAKVPQRLTIEQYNKELDAAEAQYNNGEFTSIEDVVKKAESW